MAVTVITDTSVMRVTSTSTEAPKADPAVEVPARVIGHWARRAWQGDMPRGNCGELPVIPNPEWLVPHLTISPLESGIWINEI